LTRLKEDPASSWLTPIDRAIVTVKGWAAWIAYAAFIRGAFAAFYYVISTASGDFNLAQTVRVGFGRYMSLPGLLTAALAGALIVPMRRAVVRLRASTVEKMARQAAIAEAAAIDDFPALDDEPDGRLVSLVGWVRGHGYLYQPVAGERAVGLTLHCQTDVPLVMESMHNFDLLDEDGNTALVVTGDGRMFGQANVRLERASQDDRQLVTSLDLPATAVPTDWNVFVVRDGDPVMVVGTKTTVQDLEQLQRGRGAQRTAIASTKGRPLLLFPLDAERREV
jgi:hypothetical protein